MRALIGVKAKLALYANTGLPLAGQVSESEAEEYFSSPAFKDHMKYLEFKDKLAGAILERMDTILKAFGNLGKMLARRR